MSREQQRSGARRRWTPQAPATPIAALAVAVIAGGGEVSTNHQVILVIAVVVAVLAVVCDVANWRLERDDPAPTLGN